MRNLKKKFLLIFLTILSLSIITISCSDKTTVNSEYVISKQVLKDSLLKQNSKTLVLFWTDWCQGSKKYLANYYLPLNDSIKKNNLDIKLILLASDENIPIEQVKKYRELGISSYYIKSSGKNPIFNRRAIKKYINHTFPNSNVQSISEFGFSIPVELLIDKDLKILNQNDSEMSFDFICKILNLKVEYIKE